MEPAQPGVAHATQLKIFACPTCGGNGVTGIKPCRTCRGLATVARQGGLLLYWGRPIDVVHLYQRHFVAVVEHAVTAGLLCFSALGAGSLLWEFIQLNRTGYPVWLFWQRQSLWLLVFWASVFVDSYLVYAFSLELAKIRRLPRRALRQLPVAREPSNWEEARQVPRNRQLDLSTMYSAAAVAAVEKSWQLARRANHAVVTPVHLLVAICSFPSMADLFIRLGVPFSRLRRSISALLPRFAVPTGNALAFTPEYYRVIFGAYAEAWGKRQQKVDLPELLVACVQASELVRDTLYDVEVDEVKIENVAVWSRFQGAQRISAHEFRRKAAFRPRHAGVNRAMTAVATPHLDSFSQDLTLLARARRLPPCVGRERELAAIYQIFAAGGRDSVVLVGNPGIGKRSIVNGLAHLMVAEDVPRMLQDKRLVSLSVAKIVSGVTPSVAEERLLRCLIEAARSGNIILFINEVSKMVGISAGSGASLDLAGALSQMLQQTGLRTITTALPGDYSRYLENHPLGQLLEKITIEEPAPNDAIQILEAQAGPIEGHYGVFFTYDAIAKAVELAQRYLHERWLPEKAIEILDETAIAVVNGKGRGAAVAGEDIARTIANKTNIPLTQVTAAEREKLIGLEDEIHRRVIGQDEAVKLVAAAIRRARAELRDITRPIVNLLFLGPTGVGKTELAKAVAAVYFGNQDQFIRLDMSEYQERSALGRLLGAAPGPDGQGVGGYLTEAVRRHPFSLLLLDELEKAHPDILNIFLQVMDDGRLTDAVGRTVDFTNVILIATSNACTPTIQRQSSAGRSVQQIKDELMSGELLEHFRPEFLNRFDGIIVFRPLTMEQVRTITQMMLDEVARHLAEKGIGLVPSEAAIDELAAAGYDPEFGARPLRRVIQDRVDDAIATKILAGELQRRDTIILDVGGQLTIKKPARA